MSRRLFFYITALLALILMLAFGVWLLNKYQQRKLRQQKYQQQQTNRAEEMTLKFLEGWTNRDIAEYLEKQNVLPAKDFISATRGFPVTNYDFLPVKSDAPLQGFLYPDTYRFFKSIADRSQTSAAEAASAIIKKQLDNFEKKLPEGAKNIAQKNGLSLYQAVILASIVEKEANNYPQEKQTIAGIFYNRLNLGMPLQSDATVNYATGKNEASPSQKDLETISPYNTYLHKGLPPAPISNPSIDSLNAVLKPQTSDYLYYLHDQKTGEPHYAKTFEEHIANKQKYLK